jgi:ABC-type multidrug transport system fused ATPase/permease subunit
MFVALAGVRELAPIMVAAMVAAKAGTEMASQLAVMRIREQIDALEVMAVDPYWYLVTPRFLGIVLVLPALTVTSVATLVLSSYLVAVYQLGLPAGDFIELVTHTTTGKDLARVRAQVRVLWLVHLHHLVLLRLQQRVRPERGRQRHEQSRRRLGGQLRDRQLLHQRGHVRMTLPAEVPTDNAIIRLEHVSKRFGDLVVLDDVSMAFERGKTTAIIGPSGTGKSVLLKHIVGLIQPDSGHLWIGDTDMANANEQARFAVRKRFGMCFQDGALFDSLTVGENVCFPLVHHTKMTEAQRQRARAGEAHAGGAPRGLRSAHLRPLRRPA